MVFGSSTSETMGRLKRGKLESNRKNEQYAVGFRVLFGKLMSPFYIVFDCCRRPQSNEEKSLVLLWRGRRIQAGERQIENKVDGIQFELDSSRRLLKCLLKAELAVEIRCQTSWGHDWWVFQRENSKKVLKRGGKRGWLQDKWRVMWENKK